MRNTNYAPALQNLSDVRRFFHCNDVPMYFISATNFNLLGTEDWVRHFRFINYIDCFDGRYPNLFVPPETAHDEFTSIEDINNYLLQHKAVADYVRANGAGKALFLMFDEKTEKLARALGLEVCLPPAKLRKQLDSKLVTTRVAQEAGVRCVPNVLTHVGSWKQLRHTCRKLGPDLVVQTAYGDSGHTTFMISDKSDWARHADEITAQDEVKVMRRIAPRGAAVEACVTRYGTVVAPMMTELVGFPELTPYPGGWCGNELFPDPFQPRLVAQARRDTFAMGQALKARGYRGYFELDFLVDEVTGELYLGEMNPRISGASSIINHAAFSLSDVPLILLHLLEWMGVEYALDVAAINQRWSLPVNIDSWSQFVLKKTDRGRAAITQAPPTGIWHMNARGRVTFGRYDANRNHLDNDSQALFIRIADRGECCHQGTDLGILITRGRLMNDGFQLTPRARQWIRGIKAHFAMAARDEARDLHPGVSAGSATAAAPAFKLL